MKTDRKLGWKKDKANVHAKTTTMTKNKEKCKNNGNSKTKDNNDKDKTRRDKKKKQKTREDKTRQDTHLLWFNRTTLRAHSGVLCERAIRETRRRKYKDTTHERQGQEIIQTNTNTSHGKTKTKLIKAEHVITQNSTTQDNTRQSKSRHSDVTFVL
jgi:hypothetical protein